MFLVSKLNENATIPARGSAGAAGYDLSSSEDVTVLAGWWLAVATGISIQVPGDHYARIAPRSGLTFKHGLDVGAGVIDSDYRGEIKVILFNHGNKDFVIQRGERIAQMIFEKISCPELREISEEEMAQTERGAAGFGSTGLGTLSVTTDIESGIREVTLTPPAEGC